MSLKRLWQVIGLDELMHDLWGGDDSALLEQGIAELEADLQQRYLLLVRQRSVVEGLKHRQAENQKRADRLAERVEVYYHVRDRDTAWKEALELEQTRRCIARDQSNLHLHEEAYQEQLDDVARIKRRLAKLREKLYVQNQVEMLY